MNSPITGVEEINKISLVGRMVVCEFSLINEVSEELLLPVKESKKLTMKNWELIYAFLQKNKNEDFNYSIVIGKKREIEDLNIHHAVLLAMKKAIFKLNALEDEIIIDGKFTPSDISKYNIRAVIKADDKYPQVSAASPRCPDEDDKAWMILTLISWSISNFGSEIISNAKVNKELPAKIAVYSPYALCVLSFPLLKSSLSIEGKSSWIKE